MTPELSVGEDHFQSGREVFRMRGRGELKRDIGGGGRCSEVVGVESWTCEEGGRRYGKERRHSGGEPQKPECRRAPWLLTLNLKHFLVCWALNARAPLKEKNLSGGGGQWDPLVPCSRQGAFSEGPGHLEQKVSEVFSGLQARRPAVPLVNSPWISCCLFLSTMASRGLAGGCNWCYTVCAACLPG